MLVILQTWCQIQRTSLSILHVHCCPGLIQCNYSFAYSGINIRLILSALLLEIIGHIHACYTANLVPNAAHILLFTLCELWSRTYTMHLQVRMYRIQYSSERICAAIGDNRTFPCPLYCKFGAKYSEYPPVYSMWTVVPDIYNAFTATYIQISIFIWTYQPCYWRYLDNTLRVILQTLCQIQRTSSCLRYEICGPGHIQCIYSNAY
jgi:hypothetical protein